MTLIEITIAMAIMLLVTGVPVMLLDSSQQTYRTETKQAELNSNGNKALDQISELLCCAGMGTLDPSGVVAPFNASRLDFQRVIFDGASVDWTNLERIEFRYSLNDPNDGVDNDGDGLVDEGRVVWVQDVGLASERTTTLCSDVRESLEGETPGNGLDDNGNGLRDEAGLSFDFDGQRVRVRLSLEEADSTGRLVTRTLEETIAFRISGP